MSTDDGPAFGQRSPAPSRPFTPRQVQIADGICLGQTYAEIGAALGIAGATVRVHVQRMALALRDIEGFTGRQRVLIWCRWKEWDEHVGVLIRNKSGGSP